MSVRRAQLEIGSAEFAEWMAFAALEPFGPLRDDDRIGVLAALTANVNRDTKRRPEPFTPTDFFPRHPDDAEGAQAEQQQPDLASKLTAWAAAMRDNEPARSELRPKES